MRTEGYEEVKLKNSTGLVVNPSTEDKQDILITELEKKADLTETQPVSNASLPLPTGASTSAKQLPDNHQVTANAWTNLNTSALATEATMTADLQSIEDNQTDGTQASQFVDEVGTPYGVKHIGNKPRVSSMPYLYDIAEGNVAGHQLFLKFGYNPEIANVEEDIWSAGGLYVFPTAEAGLEILSSDNTQDIGTVLFTGTSEAGGTTYIVDISKDFTATASVGDWVILDKSGTTPEYGKVTVVATTQLTCAMGFSSGGTGQNRDYEVIDASAHTGAMAVYIRYLDDTFAVHNEIVVLNGTTVIPTVNTDIYRVNGMKVICAGSTHAAVGNLSLRNLADTPEYAHITAGYTISRQAVFTVPINKALYITSVNAAWCSPNDSKVQSARIILRANIDSDTGFHTHDLFYPYVEVQVTNQDIVVAGGAPFNIPAGIDVKVSCVSSSAAGSWPATCVLRGWVG